MVMDDLGNQLTQSEFDQIEEIQIKVQAIIDGGN